MEQTNTPPKDTTEAIQQTYAKAAETAALSAPELGERAKTLTKEVSDPQLTGKEKRTNLLNAAVWSPESMVGNLVGMFAASGLEYKLKIEKPVARIALHTVSALGVGAVLGLNAYRRYNNTSRKEHTDTAGAELDFVKKLAQQRENPAPSPEAQALTGAGPAPSL